MRIGMIWLAVFLAFPFASDAVGARVAFPKEPGIHQLGGGHRASHFAVHVPPTFNPQVYRSLLVVLHGSGNNGERYIQDWSTELGQDDMIILAPNSGDQGGYWQASDSGNILDLISKVRLAYQVSSRKIFIAGFSSGAWMAWQMGLRYPRSFKAVAALSGWTESEWIKEASKSGWAMPSFFIMNGTKDKSIPVKIEQIRDLVGEMKRVHMDVRFEEFTAGHVSPIEHLILILDWLDQFRA